MIVCVCNQVSDRQIKSCVSAGMSFNDIQLELGVATCCGSCETCATELVDRQAAASNDHGSHLHASAAMPSSSAAALI